MHNMPDKNSMRVSNPLKIFAKLFKYLDNFRAQFIVVIIAILVSVFCNVYGTFMIQGALKLIFESYETGVLDLKVFLGEVLPIILVYLGGIAAQVLHSRLMLSISTGVLYKFRLDMFINMEKLPIRYFDSRTHGEIMTRFTNDTDVIREMISQAIPNIINSVLTIIGVFTMMCVTSWRLTFAVIGMLVIMLLVVAVIGGKGSKFFVGQQSALGKVNGYIEEFMNGQKVVKVFNHEEKSKAGFEVINEAYRKTATTAMTYGNVLMPIMGNLSYINYAITAIAGTVMVLNGLIGGGDVVAGLALLVVFLMYSRQLSMPITQVSQQLNAILSALAGAERVFALIEESPEADDGYVTLVNAVIGADGTITETAEHTGQWAWKHPHRDGTLTYTEVKGAVQFADVVFGYEPDKTVLDDIDLYVAPGEKLALVGSTGAGKTTITNLINRFYDLPDGKIRYDGININKIKKADLRRSLSMVLQDTHLFTGTVMENIRYGNLDATDEQCVAAARLANADFFISHLPEGYGTMITADGANLSQGQRQLIAIARAAVADPPVLILDEATSSIDTRTEAIIEQGMNRLMEGRTVIIIAHRLSTVRNANMIIVLEHGKIIERGNHEKLLADKGRYYKLYTGMFEQ